LNPGEDEVEGLKRLLTEVLIIFPLQISNDCFAFAFCTSYCSFLLLQIIGIVYGILYFIGNADTIMSVILFLK
jgi:hypothetical protein